MSLRALALVTVGSLFAIGCVSSEDEQLGVGTSLVTEKGIDHDDVGSQELAGTGDSSDYVRVTGGWGYRMWTSGGIHKVECIHAGVIGGKYYTASYQGWSNTSHCSAAGKTGYLPSCSGSGVWNHNTDHYGGLDHWFGAAGASHDAADAHENCSYSWATTCNSKDWMEHFVDVNHPYWEDGH